MVFLKTVKAYKGQRLDQIIYKEYSTLESDVVNTVLSANTHLLSKLELEAGDVVKLPKIEAKEPKGKHLW